MRIFDSLPAIGIALMAGQAFGQQALPGKPEDNGVRPVSDTLYLNTSDTLNNTKTESLGIGIARNGNVIVGWEDDGEGLNDLEAVWTLVSDSGTWITPATDITSKDPDYAGQTVNSRFLSFFRPDKTPTPGRTSWGPKIKANPFGDGIGMGATAFDLAKEVTELSPDFDGDSGDFPAVQLLNGEIAYMDRRAAALPAQRLRRVGCVLYHGNMLYLSC